MTKKHSLLISLALASMSLSATPTNSEVDVSHQPHEGQTPPTTRMETNEECNRSNTQIPELDTKPTITNLPDPVFELPVMVITPD